MPISDTLTKRLAAARHAEAPEPLKSAPLIPKVRNQVLHAFLGAVNYLGKDGSLASLVVLRKDWDNERGVFDQYLDGRTMHDLVEKTAKDFHAAPFNDARDFIELACMLLNTTLRRTRTERGGSFNALADAALDEINTRFREEGLAYRFEPQLNQLVNIGTEHTHEKIVRPALHLLAQAGFEGAVAEFSKAFDHIGEGNWKDAVTAAGRAFEATMKAICTARGWPFEAKANAETLVSICLSKGLLPQWLSGSSQAFVAMMKAGVPHVRNNAGAHGDPPDAAAVTETLARYAINQAASSVLLLLERHRDLPRGS